MKAINDIFGEVKNEQRKVAFVLSGGGARGGFQVGFLRAAIEFGFFPDIVTGTSIGALNGIAYVQGVYDFLEDLWKNMSFETIFGSTGKHDAKIENFGEFGSFFMQWLFNQKDKNGALLNMGKSIGVQPEGLERVVYDNLDENMVRNSKIEFALNTTQVYQKGEGFTRFKETTLAKEEIPENQLGDYIIASSSFFPIIQAKNIGADLYIDGGITNNSPWEPALQKGANDIIVVHLDGFGLNRTRRKFRMISKMDDVRVMVLKPESNIGSIVDFNSLVAQKGLQTGYDAGRSFFEEYLKTINLNNKKAI